MHEEIFDHQFVDIPGYEGYYQINKLGIVRSLDRAGKDSMGRRCIVKGRVLKHSYNNNFYLKVGFSIKNKLRNYPIHILLGRTFKENNKNFPVIRHLNDIKDDNRLVNLEWGTHGDNANDCVKNGNHRSPRGESHHWYGKRRVPPNKGITGPSSLNNKHILNTKTGEIYHGTQQAAEAIGVNASTLRVKLSGHGKNDTSLIYIQK